MGDAARFCPYCGTPAAVLHTAPAAAPSAALENLLARAASFEQAQDFTNAISYYNQALDMDFSCEAAKKGLARVQAERDRHVYARQLFTVHNTWIQLRYQRILVMKKQKVLNEFSLSRMRDIYQKAGIISFTYDGEVYRLPFATYTIGRYWMGLITDAQKGVYPD